MLAIVQRVGFISSNVQNQVHMASALNCTYIYTCPYPTGQVQSTAQAEESSTTATKEISCNTIPSTFQTLLMEFSATIAL